MEPTLNDPKLRTYRDFAGIFDIGMKYNPWRAPGYAPVDDPCGVITGNQPGEHVDGAPKPGTRGSSLPATKGPNWPAGCVLEHLRQSWRRLRISPVSQIKQADRG